MRINNIPYLLKEGIRGLFAHGLQSASAFAVTVFSLLITGTVANLSGFSSTTLFLTIMMSPYLKQEIFLFLLIIYYFSVFVNSFREFYSTKISNGSHECIKTY